MSDNPNNVARIPRQQPAMPAKVEIDFPAMIGMCIEKGLDPQVIVTMFQSEKDRQHKEALDIAKAEIYGEMLPVLKDGHNKHLGNKYATIPAMMSMLAPITSKYGMFVGFECGALAGEPPVTEGAIRVRIAIGYGGYTDRASYLDEPITRGGVRGGVTQMNEQQAITSATTYAARTLLKLKFNILTQNDDDDADTASSKTTTTKEKPAPPTAPDPAELFPSVAKNLARASSVENVDNFVRNDKVVAFRALQTPANQALIDQMVADRRAELVTARMMDNYDQGKPSGDLPDDLDMEGAASENGAGALIARVNVCHTQLEINQITTAPDFTKAMADLFPPDKDAVMAAIKRREAQVGGANAG